MKCAASKDLSSLKCTTSTAPSSPLAVYWTAEVASENEGFTRTSDRSVSSRGFEVERFGVCHSSHSSSTEASSQLCGDGCSLYRRSCSSESMGLPSNSGVPLFFRGSVRSSAETPMGGCTDSERPSEGTGYAVQESVHGYQTGLMYSERKGVVESGASHKRARPEASGGFSTFNIAPRASKKSRRRTTSGRGVMWPCTVLRHILPSMKPESVINCLVGACERNPMAIEYVKSQMMQDPHCRRVFVRNVPYGTQAGFLAHTIEEAFGEVERIALLTNKGMGAVVFRAFESAFRAALGMPTTQILDSAAFRGPPAASSVVALGGRVLQFRFLASSDKFWDLLESGPSGGLAVWQSNGSAGSMVPPRRRRVVAPGPNRRKRHFYQVVVRDLAPGTNEQTLASAFAHFGDIKRISVPMDTVTGVPKNHGYITFNNEEDALRAVQQTQRMIDNRLTFVTLSTASRRRHRSQSVPTAGNGGYYNHRGRRSRSSKQKPVEEN